MPRFAYVNGRYVRHADATVHVEDRGFQFSDGVYEVIGVVGGRRIDEELHFKRLYRSLSEIGIETPYSRPVLRTIMDELLRRNRLRNAILYLQITRGCAPRDHAYPVDCPPSLVMTVRPMKTPSAELMENGVKVVTIPDIRWKRADIKSVSLLPNVMGKQQARIAGAYEAWQVDEQGYITEGTSTNAWIVTADRIMVTRPADHSILNGVTRCVLLELAGGCGMAVEERPFTLDEARSAAEAFITSTTSLVLPVTHIDGQPVGGGVPGAVAEALLQRYRDHMAHPS